MISERPIALPRELNERSSWKAVAGCLYALLLFFGAWYGTTLLVGKAEWSVGLRALAALPVLVLGGYGMLLLGFMGHDGTHFNLHENRLVSSLMGIGLTAPVFPYLVMGFTISHWNHHKYTNSDLDPDAVLFSRFNSLWTRALVARPFTFWEYGSNTVRLALGRPLPFAYQFPLPKGQVQLLAAVNLLASAAFGAFYAYVCLRSRDAALALGALYLFGTVVSGLSPYVEHTGTLLGRGHDTRSARGWWWDVLTLGNNYHLEHHLYPTLPFYNLKAAHRYLVAQGYYTPEKFVSNGVVDTYRYALGKYPYPNVQRPAPKP
jgi:beta-carotene hydroxylase